MSSRASRSAATLSGIESLFSQPQPPARTGRLTFRDVKTPTSAPLFSSAKSWTVVIHTVRSGLTLSLVLLQNAGRRDAEAAHAKLNVLADALAR
jgi:hypothetical protein